MRADLHMHSLYSDGEFSPMELARRAKERGVKAIAITDHDTLSGEEEKRAAAAANGLEYVSGWEVSAWVGTKVHILGYHSVKNAAYDTFCDWRAEETERRVADMIAVLNAKFHTDVTREDAEKELSSPKTPLHTACVTWVFSKRLGMHPNDVYRAYFAAEGRRKVWNTPSPEEAIALIRATGGIAVLAHPGRIRLPFEEREKLMEKLVSGGIAGIECTYPTHTLQETEYFLRFQREHGLFATGGSDFHGDGSWQEVGKPVFEASNDLLKTLSPS